MKENKKKIIIASVILFIILALIVTIIIVNHKEDIPVISKDKIEDTITQYLIEEDKKQEDNYKEYSDFKTFINLKIVGIELDGNKTYVYAWALVEDYHVKEDVAELGSGSSMAYKFTMKNDKITKCENPEDGDGYAESMKLLFPEEIYEKLVAIDGSEDLIEGLDEQVKQYYGDKYNKETMINIEQ